MDKTFDCKQVCTFLYAYLDNELDNSTSLQIESHLEACESCAGKFEQFQRVREEIRHHVLQLKAPEKLKSDIKRLCKDSNCYVRYAIIAVAASALLVLSAFVVMKWIPAKEGLAPAVVAALPDTSNTLGHEVHLEGEIICLRCLMNQQKVGLMPCSEVGHAYAVKTNDGAVWVLLPSTKLNEYLEKSPEPLHQFVKIDGLVASKGRPLVDVASLTF